jgi:predicted ATPase/DNA-binding CsgD family transcriptional regulator/uncharacterized protein HemY
MTTFVGRSHEAEVVTQLLQNGEARLLTLTGPGGVGKTRLALKIAGELRNTFVGGVYFVALAAVQASEQVIPAIAQAMGLHDNHITAPFSRIVAALHDKPALLVLDNFEHVLEAAFDIGNLLAEAPHVSVLVTSRSPLRLYGEYEFPVPPLDFPLVTPGQVLPTAPTELTEYPAIVLFLQRVRAVQPDFQLTSDNASAIAAICARLDGLPLAIELAAARTKLFSPQALLQRLEGKLGQISLDLLSGGARNLPQRQQTIRQTIDWSYQLLEPHEQLVFARLGAFVGGCSVEAAQHVLISPHDHSKDKADDTILEHLSSLVDKSLLRQSQRAEAGTRFVMLATIREYALERLMASGEVGHIQYLHAKYFLELVEQAVREFESPARTMWIERLEADYSNIRAALLWSLYAEAPTGTTQAEMAEIGLRLAGALVPFWIVRIYIREGCDWLQRALTLTDGQPSTLQALALIGIGRITMLMGDTEAARAYLTQGLEAAQAADDVEQTIQAYTELGWNAYYRSEYARATEMFQSALDLARVHASKGRVATLLLNVGSAARDQGNYIRARALFEESLQIVRELDDKTTIVVLLQNLGRVAHHHSKLDRATALAQESLVLAREMNHMSGIASALLTLGWVARTTGDHDFAMNAAGESLAYFQQVGDKRGSQEAVDLMSSVAKDKGDYARARALAEQSLQQVQEAGIKWAIANAYNNLGWIAYGERQYTEAQTHFRTALALQQEMDNTVSSAALLGALGRTAYQQGLYNEAWKCLRQAITLFSALGESGALLWTIESVAVLVSRQGHPLVAAKIWGMAQHLREVASAVLPAYDHAEYYEDTEAAKRQADPDAFDAAWQQGRALTPADLDRLVAGIKSQDAPPPLQPARVVSVSDPLTTLTARERDVLRLVAQGLTNPQVAQQLVLSTPTVNAYLRSIYSKLGVNSRAAATRYAIEHDLLR